METGIFFPRRCSLSRAAHLSLAMLLALFLTSTARAAEVIERYDNGLVKAKYVTNAAGQKIGDYLENYPTGKIKLRCNYKADQLDGSWISYYESGGIHIKTAYATDQLHGPYLEQDEKGKVLKDQIFFNGLLLYPRSQRQIKDTLTEIGVKLTDTPLLGGKHSGGPSSIPAPVSAPAISGPADPVNIDALKRLNAYRYLAGVPWNVTLNADYCQLSRSGAKMLEKLGHLDHHPANPGLPDAEFRLALEATTHGNLHEGFGTRSSVDGFIYDSDPKNIDRVGHRRWCLNPYMLQAGFGEAGKFSVMYAHDQSRHDLPDYDFVAFPVPGFMPVNFFGSDYAWHVSLNPQKFQNPTTQVKVAVYPFLASGSGVPDPAKRGQPLELNYFKIDTGGFGINNAIIFRPKGLNLKGPQTRFWVEISGLKKSDDSDAKVEYLVDFCSL
jgi:hypothetical protein